jgi:hypothetical protein
MLTRGKSKFLTSFALLIAYVVCFENFKFLSRWIPKYLAECAQSMNVFWICILFKNSIAVVFDGLMLIFHFLNQGVTVLIWSQFEHFGSWSLVLVQCFAVCGPAHFTHLGWYPQCRLEWPKFWQLKYWVGPYQLRITLKNCTRMHL